MKTLQRCLNAKWVLLLLAAVPMCLPISPLNITRALAATKLAAANADMATVNKLIADQDYRQAVATLNILKERGVPEAYSKLGYLYDHGLGVATDHQKAIDFYIQAALMPSSGGGSSTPAADADAEAAVSRKVLRQSKSAHDRLVLANCCEIGVNGPQNYARSAELFTQLMQQDGPEAADATNNLGYLYQNGLGVKKDYAKAMELYQKAADKGLMAAVNNVGYMYYRGLGVKKDLDKARELFEKGAQTNEPSAQSNLGWLYLRHHKSQKDYETAVDLLAQAASTGLPAARLNLGYALEYGLGIKRNPKESSDLYEIAQKQLQDAHRYVTCEENAIVFNSKGPVN